jgi:hypothetical protein
MADFSMVESALAGVRFVRERPRAAATWAGLQLLVWLVFGVLIVEMAGPAFAQVLALQTQPLAARAASPALLGQLAPFYGVLLLFSVVFYPVLFAAMNRAVLRPQDQGFAYLRLSAKELDQFLLMLLVAAVALVAEIVAVVVCVIVAIVLAFALYRLAESAAYWAIVAAAFLAYAAMFCFWVRLSLCSALTFDKGKVDLFGSWALTRGRFWKLLGTYLLVLALTAAMWLLILALAVALSAASGRGLSVDLLLRPDTTSLQAYFTPARLVLIVVSAAASALFWPLMLMPAPEIYRQLSQGQGAA